jgi:hypothetical protein
MASGFWLLAFGQAESQQPEVGSGVWDPASGSWLLALPTTRGLHRWERLAGGQHIK